MLINGFDWDSVNLEHINGHRIQNYEVEEAMLFDKPIYQKGKGGVFIAFAIAENGRYLFIVFKCKGKGLIRVITERGMIGREKHSYRRRAR